MAPGQPKQNNVLHIWGNEKTMNLNSLILTNIQSSHYFKVNLYELKTYHEVIDEIYYKVSFIAFQDAVRFVCAVIHSIVFFIFAQVGHLEPWEKGSRKTSGQTGMCGGVCFITFPKKKKVSFFTFFPFTNVPFLFLGEGSRSWWHRVDCILPVI